MLSGSAPVTINVANFTGNGIAQMWQLTSANQISRLDDLTYTGASVSASLPAQSITLFVLPSL
jgi:O-glycosyl hydrolase